MTLYATEAADALATLAEAGAAVTFTQTIPGTYDAATDTWSAASTVTVTGYAIRDTGGDPRRYAALSLVQSEAPRLLFGSDTAGSLPAPLSTVVWGGITYTVRDIEPVAPDGTAIVAYIIVSR
jgi:hypothetical protein